MKKIAVLGAGESGVSAALLAIQHGWEPFVSDSASISDRYRLELIASGIEFEEGGHTLDCILDAAFIIRSPGIPPGVEILSAVRSAGLSVYSELEFASWYARRPYIAVTGTNGKTTTVRMIAHMMETAGIRAIPCGNIRPAFARVVLEDLPDWYVVEASSFQLEDIDRFHPRVAVLLNISPDHLDRYGTLEAYLAAKMNLARNLESGDYLVYGLDSPLLAEALNAYPTEAQRLTFSLYEQPGADYWFDGELIRYTAMINKSRNKGKIGLDPARTFNKPYVYNTMAASIVGQIAQITDDNKRAAFQTFENAPHRLEEIAWIREVRFINDSKATNINAAWFALDSMQKPVVWIAGGVENKNDYGMLLQLVKTRVKAIVLLGRKTDRILEAFYGYCDQIHKVETMDEAVQKAFGFAEAEDTVLLSPSCPSFDLFEDYEDRGDTFREAVMRLKAQIDPDSREEELLDAPDESST